MTLIILNLLLYSGYCQLRLALLRYFFGSDKSQKAGEFKPIMYAKAVQTLGIWALAYEVPMGGYALSLVFIDGLPILDDEAEFASLEELEGEMSLLAPLANWGKELFCQLIDETESYSP